MPKDSQHASLSEREDWQTMGPERELLDFWAWSLSDVGFYFYFYGTLQECSWCINENLIVWFYIALQVMQKNYEVLLGNSLKLAYSLWIQILLPV